MWNFNLVNLLLKVLFGFFVILGAFVFCVGLILLVENVYVSGWDLLFQCAVPFIGAVLVLVVAGYSYKLEYGNIF